jgi:hypothetical protein
VIGKLAMRHGFHTLAIAALLLIMLSFGIIGLYLNGSTRESLRLKEQSEQALMEKIEGLETFNRESERVLRIGNLGWFLSEWQEGRLDGARAIELIPPEESEVRAVMTFLSSGDETPEQLMERLPAGARCLGHFATGVRHQARRHVPQAVQAFEATLACASGPQYTWVREAARARLRALGQAAESTVDSQEKQRGEK